MNVLFLSPHSRSIIGWLLPLTISLFWQTHVYAQANQTLWRLGKVDNTAAEFANYQTANPEAVTIPADWATRTSWTFVSKGLKASVNPAMTLTFSLPEIPANGVLFTFKLLHADRIAPEMAVFSNGVMAGLIQLWGTGNVGVPETWKKTYQLYIPKELLQTGSNVFRLEASRPLYADASIDPFLYWEWDYLSLASLAQPAQEPIHGKLTHMGTSVKLGENNFAIDDNTLATAPNKLKWMGVAYSGNTVRADYWSDISSTTTQNRRLAYLNLLRDLNMSVIADNLNSQQATLDANGDLSTTDKNKLTNFFNAYGGLFQYYEIDNEPGLFNRSKAINLAIGRYVNQIKPAHVKTTAPGWAYWPSGGNPGGWERSAAHRRDVENLAQATNGHSYGQSFADSQGGSFAENLETYGGVTDGWSKEYVNTEMGTDNGHQDFSTLGSSQPYAAIFDRNTRAHLAVVDRFMHHATTFGAFSMFTKPANWTDPTLLTAYPGVNGQDTRLKTWRRLALAYATHGTPLKYEYLNKIDITGKKVYFRAVNTATLTPLPGSSATSSKILLNFVNFENTTQTMSVRVTLPGCGAVTGERIGEGDTYTAAFSTVSLNATPTLDLTLTLPPRESVQYILNQPTGTCAMTYPTGNDKIFIDAETGQITAPMQVSADTQASIARYITVAPGNNSLNAAPADGIVTYTFSVAEAGAYQVLGRVIGPVGQSDSFWVRMDGGSWIKWNGAGNNGTPAINWRWSKVKNELTGGAYSVFNLNPGSHTLQMAYREEGTKLDQLLITNNPTYLPTGDLQLPGIPANLSASGITHNSATLTWAGTTDNTAVTGYDVYNGPVLAGSVGATTTTFALTGLSQGSPYVYSVRARDAAGNSSPTSNTVGIQTAPAPRPDLIITGLSISPGSPTVNQRVAFLATVKNQGSVPTPAGTVVGVTFKVNGTQTNYSDRFIGSIAPNESVLIVADNGTGGSPTWSATATATYTIDVRVDDVNRISEDDETNNGFTQSAVVGAAEAQVAGISSPASKASFEIGETVPLAATVSSGSGVSKVEFFANNVKIGEDLSSPYTFNWVPSATGTYALVARTTHSGGTQVSSAVVVFINPVRPDLIVTDISWTPANPTTNTPIRFSAVVKNQGMVATPDNIVVGVSFYIKRNGRNTNQTYSDTHKTAIQPGQSVTLTANGGGSTAVVGTYSTSIAQTDSVEAYVDDVNRIAERFDDNNKRLELMTVSGGSGRVAVPAETASSEGNVTVFPNPAKEWLTIRASDPIESTQLSTLLGTLLPTTIRQRHPKEVELWVGNHPPGVYIILVRTRQGVTSQKVLVQP